MKFVACLNLIIFWFLSSSPAIMGQEVPLDSIRNKKADSTKVVDVSLQKPKFTPVIAPVVSPEVDLMLLVAGLFTFTVKPSDPSLPRSSIPFSVGYSTNGSFALNFRPFIYGQKDKYRLFGDIWIKDMPDHYFGVGYQNGRYVDRSDTTTSYHRFWWQVDLSLVRNIFPNLFAGIGLDFNETNANKVNQVMAEDPYFLSFGPDNQNSGLGAIVQWDSRDLAINAYEGILVNARAMFYGRFLGGQNTYSVYEIDYRHYHSLGRPGRTLTWQFRTFYSTGSIPWSEIPKLGTPFDLRAYRLGQYRDGTIVFGLTEYRHMFMRKRPDKNGNMTSRHGFVGWLGTGSLAAGYDQMKNWLPNVGVGYRFEVQSRMNARVDFGVGLETTGLYVSFNEAF